MRCSMTCKRDFEIPRSFTSVGTVSTGLLAGPLEASRGSCCFRWISYEVAEDIWKCVLAPLAWVFTGHVHVRVDFSACLHLCVSPLDLNMLVDPVRWSWCFCSFSCHYQRFRTDPRTITSRYNGPKNNVYPSMWNEHQYYETKLKQNKIHLCRTCNVCFYSFCSQSLNSAYNK